MSTPPGVFSLYDWTALPRPRTAFVPASKANEPVLTGVGLVIAVAITSETVTAASQARLLDGSDVTGQVIACLACAAGQGSSLPIGLPGIPYNIGLFFQQWTGSTDLTVTYIPLINALP